MHPILRSLLAAGGFACAASVASADITSVRLGDNTGEDWEPAIIVDGGYVYALWPHYLATSLRDSTGATCMPFSAKVKGGTTSSYMYFQSSSNGGASWSSVSV